MWIVETSHVTQLLCHDAALRTRPHLCGAESCKVAAFQSSCWAIKVNSISVNYPIFASNRYPFYVHMYIANGYTLTISIRYTSFKVVNYFNIHSTTTVPYGHKKMATHFWSSIFLPQEVERTKLEDGSEASSLLSRVFCQIVQRLSMSVTFWKNMSTWKRLHRNNLAALRWWFVVGNLKRCLVRNSN